MTVRRVVEIRMMSYDVEKPRRIMYEYQACSQRLPLGPPRLPLGEIAKRVPPGWSFHVVDTYSVSDMEQPNPDIEQSRLAIRGAMSQDTAKRDQVVESLVNLRRARDLLLPLYTPLFDLRDALQRKEEQLVKQFAELDHRIARWQVILARQTPEEIIRSTLRISSARILRLCGEFFCDLTRRLYWTDGSHFLAANNEVEAQLTFLTDWIEGNRNMTQLPIVRAVQRLENDATDLDEESEEVGDKQ